MAKLPTEQEIEAAEQALEPYKLALGKVAHAWNHMQEQLGRLFCMVANLDDLMGMSIWHALKSDRSQRDILLSAAIAADRDPDWNKDFPKAKADIKWLLQKVNALTDGRNSAIHAPIFSTAVGEAEIRPFVFYGNPNAARLLGKDILAEFDWQERYFSAVRSHAAAMTNPLLARRFSEMWPWPDRPLLPTVGQKSSHQDHNRPRTPK